MITKELSINEIKPYKNNPRKNDKAVEYVVESIKQCGYISPIIVDENYEILAGHTRYKALKKLGYKKIDCVVRDGLTEEQKKKYRVLDNKTNEFAEWDIEMLVQEIEGLDFGDLDFQWEKEKKEKKVDADVEFSEVLGEEHNYIVLYFDNDVDWLQAQSLFDIKQVMCGSTRKDGNITKSMKRIGIGRVLKGADAINKILGVKNENIG